MADVIPKEIYSEIKELFHEFKVVDIRTWDYGNELAITLGNGKTGKEKRRWCIQSWGLSRMNSKERLEKLTPEIQKAKDFFNE